MNNVADIFKAYRHRLLAFIRDRVPPGEAEDILQDVFLRLVQTEKTTSVIQVSSWLYQVSRNSIIDRSRKHKEERLPQSAIQKDDDIFIRQVTEILVDNEQTPEKEYVKKIVWEELEKALGELPAVQRRVFEQTELDGKTFKALAAESGIPVETLLSRKHYAVKHLRKRLKEVYEALLEEA